MTVNRKRQIIRNIIILGVLFIIFVKSRGLYFNPINAYRTSEKSFHYGPSEIIHIEDYSGGKYIVGKYDKWYSCQDIKKRLGFLWSMGHLMGLKENDLSKGVSFTWAGSDHKYLLHGVVNDVRIKRIEITLDKGDKLSQEDFYEDMFLFAWEYLDLANGFRELKGYDGEGRLIFEETYP